MKQLLNRAVVFHISTALPAQTLRRQTGFGPKNTKDEMIVFKNRTRLDTS